MARPVTRPAGRRRLGAECCAGSASLYTGRRLAARGDRRRTVHRRGRADISGRYRESGEQVRATLGSGAASRARRRSGQPFVADAAQNDQGGQETGQDDDPSSRMGRCPPAGRDHRKVHVGAEADQKSGQVAFRLTAPGRWRQVNGILSNRRKSVSRRMAPSRRTMPWKHPARYSFDLTRGQGQQYDGRQHANDEDEFPAPPPERSPGQRGVDFGTASWPAIPPERPPRSVRRVPGRTKKSTGWPERTGPPHREALSTTRQRSGQPPGQRRWRRLRPGDHLLPSAAEQAGQAKMERRPFQRLGEPAPIQPGPQPVPPPAGERWWDLSLRCRTGISPENEQQGQAITGQDRGQGGRRAGQGRRQRLIGPQQPLLQTREPERGTQYGKGPPPRSMFANARAAWGYRNTSRAADMIRPA